jgi:hypothetical protein
MLVKFDHLTYSANRNDVHAIVEKFVKCGYHLTLQEEQAVNMPTKLEYMKYMDATHGLHFLAPPSDGGIPVEIVSYEHTTDGSPIIDYEACSQEFTIKTSDPISCKELLLVLGCEGVGENAVSFKGALDDYEIRINIIESHEVSANLDNVGLCCPTIFVRPLNKTKAKIEQAGFKCSEIETFEVQGSSFYVFFAEGKGGELLEITSNKL